MKNNYKSIGFALCVLACLVPSLSVGNASVDGYFREHRLYQLYFIDSRAQSDATTKMVVELEQDIARLAAEAAHSKSMRSHAKPALCAAEIC
jgi:hypothetical protein